MSEFSHDHRLLEAILFASAEGMTPAALRDLLPQGADVGGLLMELQKHYEGRGVNLIDTQGVWAFRTALDLADDLTIEKQVQRKLSRAAMETLAIIAYHQPVTRAEIENIRGVATSKGSLDALMEMGWVKPGRRRETLGRPLTWVTTNAFLDHFSLEALTDLPGMDDLKAAGLLDRRPAIETLPQAELFSGQKDGEGVEGVTHVRGGEDDDIAADGYGEEDDSEYAGAEEEMEGI